MECAEKDWDLDVKHVKAHRRAGKEGYDQNAGFLGRKFKGRCIIKSRGGRRWMVHGSGQGLNH